VAEEKFCSLSSMLGDGARWLVASEMECREQFEELSLLRAWGAELCLTIIGPSQVRSPLSTRMQVAIPHHAVVVGELAALRAAMSSSTEVVLGRLRYLTSRVEVMNKLTTKFWR
jgi:hypothetical protein